MDSIAKIGLMGMQEGMRSLSVHASQLTRSFLSESELDPVEPIVNMISDQNLIKASEKIIKVSESISKTVLDILA